MVRLSVAEIAERRRIVLELRRRGITSPAAIADSILRNPRSTHLLSQQSDPAATVRDDIRSDDKGEQLDVLTSFGLPALSEFIRSCETAMFYYAIEIQAYAPGDPRRLAAIERYMAAAERKAVAQGVPMQRGVLQVDIINRQLQGMVHDGDLEPEAAAILEAQFSAVPSSAAAGFGKDGGIDALTFATSPDYCNLNLDDKPMERLILSELMRGGSSYNELVAICGMRSGKGTVGSVAVWFKIKKLLDLDNPQRYYGIAEGQTIGTANMAMSQDQAKLNVFKHCLDRVNHGGRWFAELRDYCDRHFGSAWQQTLEITLPKNILMRCGHSSAKSMVGGTNIAVAFDELCKFKTSGGKDNAEDVYRQMKATTATFGDDALILTLSSPEWTGDYGYGTLLTMAKERESSPLEDRCEGCRARAESPGYAVIDAKSHPKMFPVHMPTWEANTGLTFEMLWENHNGSANPRVFNRDFGARPSEAQEQYYPNPQRWDEQGDPGLRYPYDKAGKLAAWFKPCCDSRRYVHVDLALSRDSCGVAMAHRPVPGCGWSRDPVLWQTDKAGNVLVDEHEKPLPVLNEETGEPASNPLFREVVLDVCLQIKPEAPPGRAPEIDFEDVRDYIREWQKRGFAVKAGLVTYDGWQSVDSRQLLRKEGFKTKEFSLDRDLEGHDTLQSLINTGRLAYYPHPVLVREAKALELKKNGRRVDHPERGSKDVVDAVAGSVYHAFKYGGRRVFIGGSS